MSTVLIMARRIALAAWRYRWAAVALSWVVCGAGWAYVYTIPNSYEASARLYVDADAVLTPLLRGISIDSSLSSQLDVLQRTLLSRPNLEKLVSNTDLDLNVTGPSDLERLVGPLAVRRHQDHAADSQSVHDHLPQQQPEAGLRRGADHPDHVHREQDRQ